MSSRQMSIRGVASAQHQLYDYTSMFIFFCIFLLLCFFFVLLSSSDLCRSGFHLIVASNFQGKGWGAGSGVGLKCILILQLA